jgi:peptide/nickel transport system permease protein
MSDRASGPAAPRRSGWITRFLASDLLHSFLSQKLVVFAALVAAVLIVAAFLAPLIAPHTPFDLKTLSIIDANTPPSFAAGGDRRFLLGTDDQGRDILSTILYGMRTSVLVGFFAVLLAMSIGITLGLMSGYFGGRIDSFIMRIADIQLTFPAILIALMVDGVARILAGAHREEGGEFWVLVLAIGLSYWVQYARTVRGSTLVERNKEYVQAARLIGIRPLAIMFRHILPNVLGPVLVIATINLALAILTEATLSFLGVGLPPTQPSLGTMISIGNRFLFSGEWWIVAFPGVTLVLLVLAVNLLGDWLRDALNPRLR